MLSIKDYLTNDHRKCDTLFARMGQINGYTNWLRDKEKQTDRKTDEERQQSQHTRKDRQTVECLPLVIVPGMV